MSSKKSKTSRREEVIFLNPQTCGIYKNGGVRYKSDPATGRRTQEVDNQLAEVVDAYLAGAASEMVSAVALEDVRRARVLVPRYYDPRWHREMSELEKKFELSSVSLGALIDEGVLCVFSGHGSPSNDQRTGNIPYVKVSDIRSLRVNVNPTNLVSRQIAEMFWGGKSSGLQAWDLVTPNRASANIGEFAIILPGEEQVVLTKEVFVARVVAGRELGWNEFYLLWAFSLKAVRRQWQRVTLMQTNREDVGERYREVRIPVPKNKEWADAVSGPFREYFTTLSEAKSQFREQVVSSGFEFIANVATSSVAEEDDVAADDATNAD